MTLFSMRSYNRIINAMPPDKTNTTYIVHNHTQNVTGLAPDSLVLNAFNYMLMYSCIDQIIEFSWDIYEQ